jgi:O-antigen ligase
MKQTLKTISRWELLYLLILAPLWVLPEPWTLLPFLGLPLFWWGHMMLRGHFFPPSRLNVPLLLLAAFTLMSVFATPDLAQSAGKVMGVVLGISLYYAVIRFAGEANNWKLLENIIQPGNVFIWLILGFLAVGSAAAAAGLLGANWFSKYPLITRITDQIPRVIPPLPGSDNGFQPNAVSGTLTFFTPLAFTLTWHVLRPRAQPIFPGRSRLFNRSMKFLLLGLTALQAAWWALAQTRGAWLGLASSLVFLLILSWKPEWKTSAWLLTLLPVLMVYVYWFRAEAFQQLGLDLGSLRGENLSTTLQYRFQVWGWAGQVLQDFPLIGLGYDMFRELAPEYYGGRDLRIIAHAHNTWLDVGVTLGYGGLMAYISLWVVHLSSLWKTWNKRTDSLLGETALGLLAGWVAYFVFGLADTIPLGSKFGLAIFLALAVGQVVVKRGSVYENKVEEK